MEKLIAGNWKMNLSAVEAQEFVALLKEADLNGVEVALCVPFTFLDRIKDECAKAGIKLGAQNVSWAEKGAFTGEISPSMLIEMGAEYAIIGHSERRLMFAETDQTVNKRLKNALKLKLKPIVCVGETESERGANWTQIVLKRQITEGLKGLSEDEVKLITIAYEPVWAIGTSKSATAAQADEACGYIRTLVSNMYHVNTRVLYGGSMNPSNASSLLSQRNIDGGLIGGASLKAEDFCKIIAAAK